MSAMCMAQDAGIQDTLSCSLSSTDDVSSLSRALLSMRSRARPEQTFLQQRLTRSLGTPTTTFLDLLQCRLSCKLAIVARIGAMADPSDADIFAQLQVRSRALSPMLWQ